jgi:hypothetical protein
VPATNGAIAVMRILYRSVPVIRHVITAAVLPVA